MDNGLTQTNGPLSANENYIQHEYEFLSSQLNLFHVDDDVDLDICIYQGGLGSGKTWGGAFLGIILAQKYPGSRGLVVAKTFPLLRDTTLQMYHEHLQSFGMVRGQDYFFNKTEAIMMFPHWGRSTILFRHIQDPDKIKSINASWAHGEEISQLTEADFIMLMSRVRDPKIKRRRLFGTSNPQAVKGWIYKHFVSDNQENEGKKVVTDPRTGATEVIHYRRIIAKSTENYNLNISTLENLKTSMDPELYRIFVLGEDGDYTAGLVCKGYSWLNEEDNKYRPELPIYFGCDFNIDPMCWALFQRYNGEYHYFNELCLENTPTVEAVDAFQKLYPNHRAGIVVTGDASGNNRSTKSQKASQTDYTIMKDRLAYHGYPRVQFDIKRQNPPVGDRVAAWNALILSQEGVRRIFLNPDTCPRLKWNLENMHYLEGTSTIWEPTQREVQQNRDMKFYKHIFDGASYAVEKYDPIRIKSDSAYPKRNRIISVPFEVKRRI